MIRLLLSLMLVVAGFGRADASAPAAACQRAALAVSAETGVPADILGALTLTETGRRRDGVIQPWAWSVNAEGAGTWFDDPDRALAFAEDRLAQGRTNLDIGCFQINYRWHGQHFGSIAEMFDPLQNTRYAARFLTELHAETGDWRAAAGAFHSRSPAQAARYLTRFDSLRASLAAQGWGGMTGSGGTFNRFAGEVGTPRGTGAGAARSDGGRSGGARTGAGGDDGGFLGVGVEVPVPDMSSTGPIDLALDGDGVAVAADMAAGDGSGDVLYAGFDPADPTAAAGDGPGGDADVPGGGWVLGLPGEAPAPAARHRRSRVRAEPRTLLGALQGETDAPTRGSLAVMGGPRGALLRSGSPLIGDPPEPVAVAGL